MRPSPARFFISPSPRLASFRARGGSIVDLAWKDGRLTHARIHSKLGRATTVRCGDEARLLAVSAGEDFVWR